MKKYVVIIQCDIAHRRCSGFACTNAFYKKSGKFADYNDDTQYISFTCGGCCGKGVAAKMEHLEKKIREKTDLKPDEIAIHLASCVVTDNHHYDRCPHTDYIKDILRKKGFATIVEGSYISNAAVQLRANGVYHEYPDCPTDK